MAASNRQSQGVPDAHGRPQVPMGTSMHPALPGPAYAR